MYVVYWAEYTAISWLNISSEDTDLTRVEHKILLTDYSMCAVYARQLGNQLRKKWPVLFLKQLHYQSIMTSRLFFSPIFYNIIC